MMLERYLQFAVASSREIDAPPSKVWSIICDVDSFPSVFSGVEAAERLKDGSVRVFEVSEDDLFHRDGRRLAGADSKAADVVGGGRRQRMRVGMRHRIHRVTEEGERFFADWVVTAVDEGDGDVDGNDGPVHKSVTFYSTNLAGGITASTTWSVGPLPMRTSGDGANADASPRYGHSRSVASITLAIVPRRVCYIAGRIMCCCVFRRRALTSTEKDLEDIAAAAEVE